MGFLPIRRGRFLSRTPSAVAAGFALAAVAALVPSCADDRRTPEPSPDASFTLYLLGSSTAQGYPYDPRCDIGQIVSLLVGGEIAGRPVRVVNLAGPGKTARVTRQDARQLAESAPKSDRSFVFLYPGNNEFTRYDRRPDLRKVERTLFDEPVVSASERRRIVAKYDEAIGGILESLLAAKLAVVTGVAAVNAKDWDPNRSVASPAADTSWIRAQFTASEAAIARRDHAAAVPLLEHILAAQPGFAIAHKRLGDCRLALGDAAGAQAAYQSAIDSDGNPLRETSDLDRALRRACSTRDVAVLDCDSVLASASPDGILGFELMLDNCHPNLDGYILLARALTQCIQQRFRVETVESLSAAQVSDLLDMDSAYLQSVYGAVGQYCYTGSTLTFDPRWRLLRSRTHLERAAAIGPSADVECSLAVLCALEGDPARSLGHWRAAVALDPTVAKGRMTNRHVVQVMARHGITDLERALP